MPYVVKISAYLGKDGRPVANLKDAVLFEHKETAIMPEKSKKHIGKATKVDFKKEPIEKATKDNQAWMKGAK